MQKKGIQDQAHASLKARRTEANSMGPFPDKATEGKAG